MIQKILSFTIPLFFAVSVQALDTSDWSKLGHPTEFSCIISLQSGGSSTDPVIEVEQFCDPQSEKENISNVPVYQNNLIIEVEQVQIEVMKRMKQDYNLVAVSKDGNERTSMVFQKK